MPGWPAWGPMARAPVVSSPRVFVRLSPTSDGFMAAWAIGNELATLATPPDADGLIELLPRASGRPCEVTASARWGTISYPSR
jgi:hypothetical protein